MNAREITDLTKQGAMKLLEVAQQNASKVAGSDALANWTSAVIDNYVRFANEYAQQVYGIVAQGQEFVAVRWKRETAASRRSQTFRTVRLKRVLNPPNQPVTKPSTRPISSSAAAANSARSKSKRRTAAVRAALLLSTAIKVCSEGYFRKLQG